MDRGTVKWFDGEKGYGFITPDGGGEDLFVQHTGIAGGGFKSLDEGERVTYEVTQGRRGPQAGNVRRASASAGPDPSQKRKTLAVPLEVGAPTSSSWSTSTPRSFTRRWCKRGAEGRGPDRGPGPTGRGVTVPTLFVSYLGSVGPNTLFGPTLPTEGGAEPRISPSRWEIVLARVSPSSAVGVLRGSGLAHWGIGVRLAG